MLCAIFQNVLHDLVMVRIRVQARVRVRLMSGSHQKFSNCACTVSKLLGTCFRLRSLTNGRQHRYSGEYVCMHGFETAGHSGLVVSASYCGVKGPRFEYHRGQLCLS